MATTLSGWCALCDAERWARTDRQHVRSFQEHAHKDMARIKCTRNGLHDGDLPYSTSIEAQPPQVAVKKRGLVGTASRVVLATPADGPC